MGSAAPRVMRFINSVRLLPSVSLAAICLVSASLLFCQPAFTQPAATGTTIEALLNQLSSDNKSKHFYALRQNRPAWYGADGLNSDGRIALEAIASAPSEGLDPARYTLALEQRPATGFDASQIAYRDILLTGHLLRYISDLHLGREELKHLDSDVDLPIVHFDVVATLSQALAQRELAEYLRTLAPQSSRYAGLRSALAFYRSTSEKGGWSELPPGPAFRAGSVSEELLRPLQARLVFEDKVLADTALPSRTDVDAAVRRFQMRNGLTADGVVGSSTRSALNVSTSARVAQIAANMERLRWMPHGAERTYVQVNVADASLVVVENGQDILGSRVIVGRPQTPTPIFHAEIDDVEVNPYWKVPASIARSEIFPKLKRRPSYLSDHDMRIVNGQIQQLPGPKNALGYVKLNVTNRFMVYLHDTPSRSLFERTGRFLSHGCIRVQQIKPLASYAMTGTVTGGIDRLMEAIGNGQTVHLPVEKPIPLYVEYWTAFPSEDGLPQFRPDIYGRDRRLIAAMSGTRLANVNRSSANCLHTG